MGDHLVGVDRVFTQALDVHSATLALSNFETSWVLLIGVDDEEILDLLIVDFQHGELNLELTCLISVLRNPFENFIAGNWHDTSIFAITHLLL